MQHLVAAYPKVFIENKRSRPEASTGLLAAPPSSAPSSGSSSLVRPWRRRWAVNPTAWTPCRLETPALQRGRHDTWRKHSVSPGEKQGMTNERRGFEIWLLQMQTHHKKGQQGETFAGVKVCGDLPMSDAAVDCQQQELSSCLLHFTADVRLLEGILSLLS